jgi:hypothetical protein
MNTKISIKRRQIANYKDIVAFNMAVNQLVEGLSEGFRNTKGECINPAREL